MRVPTAAEAAATPPSPWQSLIQSVGVSARLDLSQQQRCINLLSTPRRSQTKTRARRSGPEINCCCLSCGSRNTRKLTAQRRGTRPDSRRTPSVCMLEWGRNYRRRPSRKNTKVAAPHNSLSIVFNCWRAPSIGKGEINNAMTA